ncbi:DNA-binding helix-turn-helix protein [Anaerococcus lactolyticus ATCC 51172]|uniref:DNA-binding helix-turn-helix protein n=1 Tax=Anaerococcus lactolyticus ATCC 51172 TaxID=525254 RepID=C2BHU2_9FIRM|nr:helix-turn-helix transcriptional regulator [Anaerococcus lactolyticus]EEI85527.1 DNA-binding helix-turn-helix protein [Anaerococcus lactolyticus ATCC 51172]
MINSRKEFGKKLIEIREIKGLRQADVADLSSLSQRTVGRLERGEIESASVDSLVELSKVYDIDILSLYKKYLYGNLCILEDIKSMLDINAIFLPREIRINLLEKIKLIKSVKDLEAKRYELDLLELFIKYLNSEINDETLRDNFEDLSGNKIKRENFSKLDFSPVELRILLNIASDFKSFKNIDRLEIFERCKNQDDEMIKLLAYNNLSNLYVINKNYRDALKISNEGIEYSRNNSSIDGLLYLHFINFLAAYRANKNYEEALLVTKVLLKNNLNTELNMMVNKNINNILG